VLKPDTSILLSVSENWIANFTVVEVTVNTWLKLISKIIFSDYSVGSWTSPKV
jgi:hypothetical protein